MVTVPPDAAGLRPGDAVGDAVALARLVRQATGRVRAVVLDRAALPDLVRTAAATAGPSMPLTDYRAAVGAMYWSSDGVASDPAPPVDPWPAIQGALRARGSRLTGLLALTDGERVVLPLHVAVDDGVVTAVHSPTVTTVAAADALGAEAEIYIRASWAAALQALSSLDVYAAVAGALEAAGGHGFEGAAGLLRGAAW